MRKRFPKVSARLSAGLSVLRRFETCRRSSCELATFARNQENQLNVADTRLDDATIQQGAGFPDHPHRGQTTVSYVIEGSMQHEDFLGNHGK